MIGHSAHEFEQHRGYLTGLAYRMLGSVADAQDTVQDAYLRWHRADSAVVANPRAFLSKTVTRLCLDQMKSARRRRETYVGPWLPEPLIEQMPVDEDNAGEVAHDASVALMLALERLSPLERATFILHDVFDLGFDEIAGALDRSEAACRQLAARARAHMRDSPPRFSVSLEDASRIAEAFYAAARSGDVAGLRDLLAADVVLKTDGGGHKPSALRPVLGADKVSRFFAGIARKARLARPSWVRRVTINGLPGFATIEPDGTLQTTALDIADGRIKAVYIVRNPEKLGQVREMLTQSCAEAS